MNLKIRLKFKLNFINLELLSFSLKLYVKFSQTGYNQLNLKMDNQHQRY